MTVPETLSGGNQQFDAEVWNKSDCREAAAEGFDVIAARGNRSVPESALLQCDACARR